jgi:hypothetical protein
MRDPVLAGRVEDYVEELRAHHRRLFRWTMTVVPFPFMFGPRLLEQMSPAMRTGIIYTWGGLVALFGMAVCVSAWRFDRVHAVRCPVCRTKLSANPELFLRTGKCLHCLSQRPQASPDSLPSPRVRYPLPRHTPAPAKKADMSSADRVFTVAWCTRMSSRSSPNPSRLTTMIEVSEGRYFFGEDAHGRR